MIIMISINMNHGHVGSGIKTGVTNIRTNRFFKEFKNEPKEAIETKLTQVIIFQILSDTDSGNGNFIK